MVLVRGLTFIYKIAGGPIDVYFIHPLSPRSPSEQALELVPLENTVPLRNLRGPSYTHAILIYARIRKGDW